MLEKKIIITEKNGLHARPASVFVKTAGKFKCDVCIIVDEKKVNGKSLMGVMSLGIRENQEITIVTDGEGEEIALNELIKLVELDFGL